MDYAYIDYEQEYSEKLGFPVLVPIMKFYDGKSGWNTIRLIKDKPTIVK